MSEVEAGCRYRNEKDWTKHRRSRVLTVERTVRTKRYADAAPQQYAVCVSRIESDEYYPHRIGVKRRQFVRVADLTNANKFSVVPVMRGVPCH